MKIKNEDFRKMIYEESVRILNELETEQSPLNGMRKGAAINYIVKVCKVYEIAKGLFKDEFWKPIHEIFGAFEKANIPVDLLSANYEQENGVPVRKIWTSEIPFINQNGKNDKLYMRITAAGAGSVQDPLDRYDVTVVIN